MTHTTTDAAEARVLPVTQADRDAAGSLVPLCFGASAIWQSNVRAGYYDDGEIVQAFARHRLATAEAASGAGEREKCGASPDHADILETIANVPDDWQKKGYTTALAEVRDMANVGRALMEALSDGYHYMNCPSEIVSDLQNERDEALASLPPAADPAIPDGWKLVPIEPKDEMLEAAAKAASRNDMPSRVDDVVPYEECDSLFRAEWRAEVEAAYLAALAAAPTIPATGEAMAKADAEVARIMAMPDEQILSEASAEDIEWARRFKAGLRPDRFANDAAAKALYDSWSDMPGWVPWLERGNSDMQERARREATIPATGHAATEGEG